MTHFSSEDLELSFAELEEYKVEFPYTCRDDLRVVEVEIEIPDAPDYSWFQVINEEPELLTRERLEELMHRVYEKDWAPNPKPEVSD